MGDFHACVFEGYQGYFSQKTGRVKLGQTIFPDIKLLATLKKTLASFIKSDFHNDLSCCCKSIS